jgi:hypothetical protein
MANDFDLLDNRREFLLGVDCGDPDAVSEEQA